MQRVEQVVAYKGRKHNYRTMGQIDDIEDAPHERETKRNHRERAAEHQPIDDALRYDGDKLF